MRWIKAFLIFFFLLSLAFPASGSVKELHITPEEPVKGDVVTLYGKANPEEEVKIDVSFQKEVDVKNGEYSFSLNGVEIPEGKNSFTVVAMGCEDLKVSVKILIWLTLGSEAKNGIAKITKSAPPGKYDIVIHGKSKNSSVKIKIMATGYVKADKNGEFSYSYDTSSIPPGEFLVSAGGIDKQIKLLAETSTPKPSLPDGGGGGGGGPIITETAQRVPQKNNTANEFGNQTSQQTFGNQTSQQTPAPQQMLPSTNQLNQTPQQIPTKALQTPKETPETKATVKKLYKAKANETLVKTPGFEVVFAVAGLIAALGVRRLR